LTCCNSKFCSVNAAYMFFLNPPLLWTLIVTVQRFLIDCPASGHGELTLTVFRASSVLHSFLQVILLLCKWESGKGSAVFRAFSLHLPVCWSECKSCVTSRSFVSNFYQKVDPSMLSANVHCLVFNRIKFLHLFLFWCFFFQ